MGADRYGSDVLSSDWRAPKKGRSVETEAALGLVVEEVTDDFVGEIVAVERDLGTVTLEDRHRKRRTFPLGPGFWLDGKPVTLIAPKVAPRTPTQRTASGSITPHDSRAQVAKQSRIFVEGRHDAELIEKIWGDDLRAEGVVVEFLGGIDHLADHLDTVEPGPQRRIGVLVDHLVPGSKESGIAESISTGPHAAHVLVVGHPFIDIWEAIKPERIGQEAWPQVPRSMEWKHGVCERFGWQHESQEDIARVWQFLLAKVSSFADLEPALLGRVEELIDFVTSPAPDPAGT